MTYLCASAALSLSSSSKHSLESKFSFMRFTWLSSRVSRSAFSCHFLQESLKGERKNTRQTSTWFCRKWFDSTDVWRGGAAVLSHVLYVCGGELACRPSSPPEVLPPSPPTAVSTPPCGSWDVRGAPSDQTAELFPPRAAAVTSSEIELPRHAAYGSAHHVPAGPTHSFAAQSLRLIWSVYDYIMKRIPEDINPFVFMFRCFVTFLSVFFSLDEQWNPMTLFNSFKIPELKNTGIIIIMFPI